VNLLRNFIAITGALLFLWWSWGTVWHWWASDAEEVAGLTEDMIAGFNATRRRDVMRGFAEDFRDESSGATRTEVQQVLVHLFFREIDRETKRFRLRAELPPEALEFELFPDEDPPRAQAVLRPRFYERVRGEEQLWWEAEIHATLLKRGGRWRFVHTRSVNHAARRELR
jgi:hypothetical protein